MDIYSCIVLCFAIIGATIVLALTSDIGDAIIRKKMNLPQAKKEPSAKDRILDYLFKDNYNRSTWSSNITETKPIENTSINVKKVDLDYYFKTKNNPNNKNSLICTDKFFIETPYNISLHCLNEKYTFIIGDVTITCSEKNLNGLFIQDDELEYNHTFQINLDMYHGKVIDLDERVEKYKEESKSWSCNQDDEDE